MWHTYSELIKTGDYKALARCISLVENEVDGYESLLESLASNTVPVIGITGPPGAGKSTLVDALIEALVNDGKKLAVLCVDPSSPFNLGALLGDRIRMSSWYNHPDVFIRSLATRGSLGGLHPRIIEITDILKAGGFDMIIVETVGVGQSEIEIAGLADCTVVVMVPEGGDEVQTMKAGLMEIANIFVVNKADRPGADLFIKNLQQMMAPAFNQHIEVPVIKTIAAQKSGIDKLLKAIQTYLDLSLTNNKRTWLLTEKLFHLIQQKKMKNINKIELKEKIEAAGKDVNLYAFAKHFNKEN